MRASRSQLEHQAAVSRRLARLSAELGAARSADRVPTGLPGGTPDTHTRIRPVAFGPPVVPDPPPPPESDESHPRSLQLPGPRPGRHAARPARGAPWRAVVARLPGGGAGFGPAQLTVVALVVAAGCAVTCWWLFQATPSGDPVTGPPLVSRLTPVSATSTPGAVVDPEPGASGQVVVDVAGKVRRPGIVVLPAGSRVTDALRAAGGPRHGVDLTSLNLARRLVDGEQLVVGAPPSVGAVADLGTAPGPAGGSLVNLNQADQAALEGLPEIGPVTAQAIIAFREAHGGFSSVDELLDVDGIGEATLSQLKPLVTV